MQRPSHHWRRVAPFMVAASLALGGCGSLPTAPAPTSDAGDKHASSGNKYPVLPPAGSGRGGYYLDDGPGDAPPDGLEGLADAEPRVEAYSRSGNKPYVVFGKTYTPFTDDRPFKQRGRGSWYGKKFHGQKTSSGERYDMYQMTAAHPTLPIPSYARVTHVGSGKQVIVRVNDRGPFLHGRVIDLSYSAALKLGYISHGSAELEVERLLPAEIERLAEIKRNGGSNAGKAELAFQAGAEDRKAMTTAGAAPDSGPIPVKVVQRAGEAAGAAYYLQLGAYSQRANAEAARGRMMGDWVAELPSPEVAQTGSLYRVFSGPFGTRAQADAAARQLQGGRAIKPVIVQR
jgi:rare lipoprotein A